MTLLSPKVTAKLNLQILGIEIRLEWRSNMCSISHKVRLMILPFTISATIFIISYLAISKLALFSAVLLVMLIWNFLYSMKLACLTKQWSVASKFKTVAIIPSSVLYFVKSVPFIINITDSHIYSMITSFFLVSVIIL